MNCARSPVTTQDSPLVSLRTHHPVDVFADLAARRPDAVSVVVHEHRWTREEVAAFADRTAEALLELGVRRGDRVALVRRNAAAHLILFLSCARLGAVYVPVNFRLSPAECATVLEDCDARVVICGPRHAEAFEEAGVAADRLRVVDDTDPAAGTAAEDLPAHWHRLSELHVGGPAPARVDLGDDDLVMLQYTSGSTGTPKGVRQTLGNLRGSWRNVEEAVPACAFDVTMAVAPFGHVGGFHSLTLQTFLSGGRVVVQRQFDVGSALDLVEREGVRSTFGVPTMFEAMSRHPDFAGTDLTTLAVAVVGGATATPELLEIFRDRDVPLFHSWGMTETLGAGTFLLPQDYPAHPHTVGRPCRWTQVRVVTGSGTDAAPGAEGELWVRGPNVTTGYWGRENGTADGFEPGGWLRTGDLARLHEDGFVELCGRSKDLIISGGENIHPAEIEREVLTHPDVRECVVVGVANRRWGESPLAVVVLRDGAAPLTRDALRAHLDGRLARFKFPRHLELVGELPTGSTGKVDRRALAEAAAILHSPGLPWFPHHRDAEA